MMKNVNGSGDVKLTQNNNTLLPSQSPARGKNHQWALSSRYQQVVSHQAFRFRSPWRETAPPRLALKSAGVFVPRDFNVSCRRASRASRTKWLTIMQRTSKTLIAIAQVCADLACLKQAYCVLTEAGVFVKTTGTELAAVRRSAVLRHHKQTSLHVTLRR